MQRIGALLQEGQLRAAYEQLSVLVAAHPGYAEGIRLLAGTLLALGETAEAERLLRQALALDPSWTPTLVTLSELLLASGRGPEAETLLRRAYSARAVPPRAPVLLARYYNDLRRPADALAVAAPWCTSGKADGELVAQHVASLAALGRQDEAVAT